MDFGTRRLTFIDPAGGAPELLDIRQTVHAVLVGLNYRFSLLP